MTYEFGGQEIAGPPASAAMNTAPAEAPRKMPAGTGKAALLPAGPSGLGTSACRFPGAPRIDTRVPDVDTPEPDEDEDTAKPSKDTPGPGEDTAGPAEDTAGPGEDLYTSCTAASPAAPPTISQILRPERDIKLPGLYGSGLVRRDVYAPLPYLEREWGDGSHSPLYCPATVRIDADLGEEVNDRLVSWAEKVGIYATQIGKFRDAGFGRLAMLTHPDTDDPDMLLVAAQMNAAWWAADDYYADETSLGATPTQLPPRLAMVMSAMDPPPPAGGYTRQLDEAVRADPVLVAVRSATAHMTRHATPAQVMRACTATAQMYVSWTAYAAWRYLEQLPPVWRYLAARQHDSFYTSMTLIDIVAGYELPANLFYGRRFYSAVTQAGTASVIVNDLYSVDREAADELPDSNLVLLIAAEENCPVSEAIERAVQLHNDFVRGFEASQRQLAAIPSAELQRFLRGAQAWMGGGFEWHSTSNRYK